MWSLITSSSKGSVLLIPIININTSALLINTPTLLHSCPRMAVWNVNPLLLVTMVLEFIVIVCCSMLLWVLSTIVCRVMLPIDDIILLHEALLISKIDIYLCLNLDIKMQQHF